MGQCLPKEDTEPSTVHSLILLTRNSVQMSPYRGYSYFADEETEGQRELGDVAQAPSELEMVAGYSLSWVIPGTLLAVEHLGLHGVATDCV